MQTDRDRDGQIVAVVRAWHDALNDGAADRLAALSHDDIEVGGPRGTDRGVATLRAWAARSGVRLEPGRAFARDRVVVVAQRATWRAPDTGQPGEPHEVASAFHVDAGRIHRVVRYADLAAALLAADLTEADELPLPES